METVLLIALYLLPMLIARARGLGGLSCALIAAGLALLPGLGWVTGLYFALADSPDRPIRRITLR